MVSIEDLVVFQKVLPLIKQSALGNQCSNLRTRPEIGSQVVHKREGEALSRILKSVDVFPRFMFFR